MSGIDQLFRHIVLRELTYCCGHDDVSHRGIVESLPRRMALSISDLRQNDALIQVDPVESNIASDYSAVWTVHEADVDWTYKRNQDAEVAKRTLACFQFPKYSRKSRHCVAGPRRPLSVRLVSFATSGSCQ